MRWFVIRFRLMLLFVPAAPLLFAQQAITQIEMAEGALQKHDDSRAFTLMVNAMKQARASRQTALYLRAANSMARLALHRDVQYDSAFALLREAARSVAFSRSDTALAALYYHLATFYKNDYHAEEAIRFYNQSASIYEQSGNALLKAAGCYHGLGDVYKYTVFNFQLAEEYYERALDIREKLHFSDTVILYRNYYNLAATNRSQQDYEKALSYGTVAVGLSDRMHDVERQEFANSMMGNIYRDMGNSREAIHSYEVALKLNQISGNTNARASHFQNLGETMFNDSLYNDALRFYAKAEALFKVSKDRDERLFLHMLNNKARAYSQKGDHADFERTVQQLFGELNRTKRARSKEAADTYLMIAEHYARQEKYYTAVDQCQLALIASVPQFQSMDPADNPTVTMIGTSFSAGEILAKKGEYLSRLYRATRRDNYLRAALSCLYLAEQLLSEERNTLDTEDAKWAFLDTKYTVYESIIASLYESWKQRPSDEALTQAYQFFERSKARSLADALAAAEHARLIGSDDSLMRVHARLRAEELTIENRISDLAAKGNRHGEIAQLRTQLVALDRRLQECAKGIEQNYPGYFNAKYGQVLRPLADVQAIAGDEHRVLIEYFWGAEWVYGLGISADTLIFKRVGKSDSVSRAIAALLTHLHTDRQGPRDETFQSFVTSAHALYGMLVQPFEGMLGTASLQVIPDGAIGQVPFDILLPRRPDHSGVNYRSLKYLLKDRAIGYAYSAVMLRPPSEGIVSNPSLLAVGFTGGKPERALNDHVNDLQEIEGAEKELEALSRRFRNGRFLRDNEATESNFKAMSPSYDIIHLAIHGRGDQSSNFSASLFFRTSADTLDDGIFHAYELYGLKLKAMMAVLTACESGIGRDYRGEGMISMASAFTSAGCENTLMSLWKVNDQASISLMDDFYQLLLTGLPIDEALQKAKLNYLEHSDEITADPKSWAPLVAYGSLHQVFRTDNRRPYLILVLAIGALIAGGTFYALRRSRYNGGSRSPL